MIDRLFEELKTMHAELFPSGLDYPWYPTGERSRLENRYFVAFVLLTSHPAFRAGTSIRALVAKLADYRSSRLEQVDFQNASQQLFLAWHAQRDSNANEQTTSFCVRSGWLGRANTVADLQGLVIRYLKWRLNDEWRFARTEERAGELIRAIHGIHDLNVAETGRSVTDREFADVLEREEPLSEFHDGDDAEPLTQEAEEVQDAAPAPSLSVIKEELCGLYGIRFIGGEAVFPDSDMEVIKQAADEFFNQAQITEAQRQRLGVWGAFHVARSETYHDGGSLPATESGYAKEAERLGYGRAGTVGDTLNRRLGVARGYSSTRARSGSTLQEQFFQSKGWAPSADDSTAARYRKDLLRVTFKSFLAQIALEHLETTYGVTPRVPEYKR